MTQDELGQAVDVSRRTIQYLEKGRTTTIELLERIALELNAETDTLIRKPSELVGVGSEWDLDRRQRIGRLRTAPNGLKFEVFKIPSRQIKDRFTRAKLYDQRSVATDDAERLKTILMRHAEICHRLSPHPQFPKLITSTSSEDEGFWWILEEWVEGRTFEQLIKASRENLPWVMKQLAEALDVLHKQGIVHRELSPKSIIVREDGTGICLTDFELGKLLENVPTVSPTDNWRQTVCLAPEVASGGSADARADIYSWGRLIAFALLHRRPNDNEVMEAISQSKLPARVKDVTLQCLSRAPSKRPKSMAAICKAIRKWE